MKTLPNKKHGRLGRPTIDPNLLKIPVGYRLPQWLVDFMRDQDKPSSILIEEAVCEKHNLKAPK